MFKNNGKKTALSIASTACLCLLLVAVVTQHHRFHFTDDGETQEDAAPGSVQVDDAKETNRKGFSAYISKLTRGRREAEPSRTSDTKSDPAPAEDITADDIFIAVKTTKKFHQSRLNLLLDTWISRNVQQVKTKMH